MPTWTDEEIEFLQKNYMSASKDVLESKLNRSIGTIRAKASSLNLKGRDVKAKHQWSDKEIAFLKKHADESNEWLSESLGRSVRAVQHKVVEYSLRSIAWTDEQIEWIKKYSHYSPKEFKEATKMDRSVEAISQKMREVAGTARKTPVFEKDVDIAWLFGMIFSDGYVNESRLAFQQVDAQLIDEICSIIEKKVRMNVGYRSVNNCVRMWSSSIEYASLITKEPSNPVSFLNCMDENYPWVYEEPYVQNFLGGIFDGDGFLKISDRGASEKYPCAGIAVKGKQESERLQRLLKECGFKTARYSGTIEIRGGKEEISRFVEYIECRLKRKSSSQKVEFEEGVHVINRRNARKFLVKYHYLGTLPEGTRNYAYVDDGEICAVAIFRKARKSKDTQGELAYELVRFAISKNEKNYASKSLAAVLRRIQEEDFCDVVVSYADLDRHEGTIYKALGFEHVHDTGEVIVLEAEDGVRFQGRDMLETAKARGYDVEKMNVVVSKGKRKYLKYI